MRRSLSLLSIGLTALLLPNDQASAQSNNLVQSAIEIVQSAGAGRCSLLEEERQDAGFEPEVFKFQHKEVYDDAPKTYRLIRVPCWLGAYNQGDMYVLADPYDELTLMSFAVPTYEVRYRGPDELTQVRYIRVNGYTARSSVVMSGFDPNKREITEHNLSRGLGDASTSAAWRFKNNNFSLIWFDVDASYDGEINARRVVNFGGAQ